jgi:cation transport ATPase
VDRATRPETATYLLRLHGAAAMAMLVLLGALLPLHVRVGWRRRRNRASGAVMLVSNAILVVTAFGLYYTGSETLRQWTSDLHLAIGLGLPVLLAGHIVLGRRTRGAVARERGAALRRGR